MLKFSTKIGCIIIDVKGYDPDKGCESHLDFAPKIHKNGKYAYQN